jgi:hypothetical protein
MAASSTQSSEAQKKRDAPLDVEVEVLGPEESQSAPKAKAASASTDRQMPPQGIGTAWAGLAKSAAFRQMASLAVALAADAIEVAFPPAWLVVDAFATLSFFLIWGLRWEIAVVLLPELIPGMNVFPSWTLLAMYLKQKDAENG